MFKSSGMPNSNLAQQGWEFRQLLQYVKGAKSILEIGSRHGETLIRFALVADHKARIVSLDSNAEGTHEYFAFNANALSNYDFHAIIADSHNPETVEVVRNLGPYDFCFIDGDHTYEGVKADYENYGPMANIIAFHDIDLDGVRDFWNQTRRSLPMMEFVHSSSKGQMGIGVLIKNV